MAVQYIPAVLHTASTPTPFLLLVLKKEVICVFFHTLQHFIISKSLFIKKIHIKQIIFSFLPLLFMIHYFGSHSLSWADVIVNWKLSNKNAAIMRRKGVHSHLAILYFQLDTGTAISCQKVANQVKQLVKEGVICGKHTLIEHPLIICIPFFLFLLFFFISFL